VRAFVTESARVWWIFDAGLARSVNITCFFIMNQAKTWKKCEIESFKYHNVN